jgi:hypothetical protein
MLSLVQERLRSKSPIQVRVAARLRRCARRRMVKEVRICVEVSHYRTIALLCRSRETTTTSRNGTKRGSLSPGARRFPDERATTLARIEEERRVLHVAVTRARDRLVLTAPLRYPFYGRRRAGQPTAQLSPFMTTTVQAHLVIRPFNCGLLSRTFMSCPSDGSGVTSRCQFLVHEVG